MFVLHQGTRIESADGDYLGDVDRLVIDPSGRKVTHVVVRKGVFFPDDRVIPVDTIDHADEAVVRLRTSVDADELPPFEEGHFVELDEATIGQLGHSGAGAYAWAYPLNPSPVFPRYPTYPPAANVDVERNVPEDSAIIEPGTDVVTIDGEKLGKIREVRTDEFGALSHVIVDPGLLQAETLVPAHWISKVDEDRVEIGVGADSLRSL